MTQYQMDRREQLLEDSGVRFTEAGLAALDPLEWQEFAGLISDLEEQERELERLIWRDGEIYWVE